MLIQHRICDPGIAGWVNPLYIETRHIYECYTLNGNLRNADNAGGIVPKFTSFLISVYNRGMEYVPITYLYLFNNINFSLDDACIIVTNHDSTVIRQNLFIRKDTYDRFDMIFDKGDNNAKGSVVLTNDTTVITTLPTGLGTTNAQNP